MRVKMKSEEEEGEDDGDSLGFTVSRRKRSVIVVKPVLVLCSQLLFFKRNYIDHNTK